MVTARTPTERSTLREVLLTLATALPDQRTVTFERGSGRDAGPDAVGRITGPDGRVSEFLVESNGPYKVAMSLQWGHS